MKIKDNIILDKYHTLAEEYNEATNSILNITNDQEDENFSIFFHGFEYSLLRFGCGNPINPFEEQNKNDCKFIETENISEIKQFIKELRIWCDNTENIINRLSENN